ncbi:M48 family metalloprotease [Planctomycetota bacterium]
MKTKCPHCSKTLRIADHHAGHKGRCPACKEKFRIPNLLMEPCVETQYTKSPCQSDAHRTSNSHALPPAIPSRHQEQESLTFQSLKKSQRRPDADIRIDINRYRHPKEKVYFRMAVIVSLLVWLPLSIFLIASLVFMAFLLIPTLVSCWIAGQFFKARIFGHCVRVSQSQYESVYTMLQDVSSRLGIRQMPNVFIMNSEGAINAVAQRFVGKRYVLLYSSLVDLLYQTGQPNQLKFVVAHELAHYAAGHVSFWKNLLIRPALLLPHFGLAYTRACELTADRIALAVTGDPHAAKAALAGLAAGSQKLASQLDIQSFMDQEAEVTGLFGFISELYAPHPRLTKRVCEIDGFVTQRVSLVA